MQEGNLQGLILFSLNTSAENRESVKMHQNNALSGPCEEKNDVFLVCFFSLNRNRK